MNATPKGQVTANVEDNAIREMWRSVNGPHSELNGPLIRFAALIESYMNNNKIAIDATKDEADWIRHAAKLRDLSMSEYIKRAINASLRRDGVDAVLFNESDELGDVDGGQVESSEAGQPSNNSSSSSSCSLASPAPTPLEK